MVRTVLAVCIAAALAGCGTHYKPVAAAEKLTAEERQFEAVWQASQDVLERYFFRVDRLDRRAGIMTTEPMTGRHWFEFWRRDAVTAADLVEGTIQTVYRIAEVQIERASEDPPRYRPKVIVYAYRSNRRAPQVTSTSEAYDLFKRPGGVVPARTFLFEQEPGASETQPAELPLAAGLPDWLVPLRADGRDAALEAKLASEIKAAAAGLVGRL